MLSKFSVKKPYTVLVGVVMIIVLGIVSFTKMTTDLLPNINLPYVIVMTTYVGASPETVEMVVTKPVESSMATVSNIAGISSSVSVKKTAKSRSTQRRRKSPRTLARTKKRWKNSLLCKKRRTVCSAERTTA